MTDPVDAFRHWEKKHNRENYGRYDAFAAGADWQREQDAKMCRSLRDSGNPSTWVAETCARTIESKQDTPAPKPCQHECWESSPGKPDACARCGYVVTNQDTRPDYYWKGRNGATYSENDPEVTCQECERTFRTDPFDRTCRLCDEGPLKATETHEDSTK